MNYLVVGCGYGDEGKGQTVSRILSTAINNPDETLVVRFNGGPQCGHTVEHGNRRHVCAQFGSGVLQGASTYWSKFCPWDPVAWLNELKALETLGIEDAHQRYYLHIKAPLVTPCDIQWNRMSAGMTGNGTVGAGHGTTLAREEAHYSLLVEDLMYPAILEQKLVHIQAYYIKNYGLFPEGNMVKAFLAACADVVSRLPPDSFVRDDPEGMGAAFSHMIFEGGQGLMLDKDIGFFPHVTRGNASLENVEELNMFSHEFEKIYLVTRAYATRHGTGPLFHENSDKLILKNTERETNVLHPYQGKFRRGVLDASVLRYAINKDSFLDEDRDLCTLVVTCLDQMETFPLFNGAQDISQGTDLEFLYALLSATGIKHVLGCHSSNGITLDGTD